MTGIGATPEPGIPRTRPSIEGSPAYAEKPFATHAGVRRLVSAAVGAQHSAVSGSPPDQDERLLYDMIPHRRTNRFPFDDRRLPGDVFADLVRAAHEEGATLVPVRGRTARRVLDMVAVAEDTLAAEETHRAEPARWTGSRTRCDGVPDVVGLRPWEARRG